MLVYGYVWLCLLRQCSGRNLLHLGYHASKKTEQVLSGVCAEEQYYKKRMP